MTKINLLFVGSSYMAQQEMKELLLWIPCGWDFDSWNMYIEEWSPYNSKSVERRMFNLRLKSHGPTNVSNLFKANEFAKDVGKYLGLRVVEITEMQHGTFDR